MHSKEILFCNWVKWEHPFVSSYNVILEPAVSLATLWFPGHSLGSVFLEPRIKTAAFDSLAPSLWQKYLLSLVTSSVGILWESFS